MSTVFTFPGKCGDALHQWYVAHHWQKETGGEMEVWLDEGTCKNLVPLFAAQPGVTEAKLVGGVESYHCGGQPFHMNLPTSAFAGNTVYHLGLKAFPVRQISLQTRESCRVPLSCTPEQFSEDPCLVVGEVEKANRLVLHGQSVCPHSQSTPSFWKFLAGVHKELEGMFDEIVFVGSPNDREVGLTVYPEWKDFDDGGDFLKLARFVAGSRCMIGAGSAPIVVAGCLKIPAIRVHDIIGNDAPKVIWNNLGSNQVNETEIALRTEWPVFRDRWLVPVD